MKAQAPMKMQKFLALARVLRAFQEQEFAPILEPQDALSEIDDCVTLLKLNFEDEDRHAAKIENAALLLGHTLALAELLMEDVTEEELEAWIAANEPESEDA